MVVKSLCRLDGGGYCTLDCLSLKHTSLTCQYRVFKRYEIISKSNVYAIGVFLGIYRYICKDFLFQTSYMQIPKLKIMHFRVRFFHSHYDSYNSSVVPMYTLVPRKVSSHPSKDIIYVYIAHSMPLLSMMVIKTKLYYLQ